MFEIQKNDFMSFRMMPDRMKADPSGIYDFTFEGRYIIYHYCHQVMNHYVALDKTTGLGSSVMMTRERMDDHNYPMMIPAILYAIKYTGDRRMNMGEQIQRGNWIDMIFRCLLPQIGFSVREDQVRINENLIVAQNSTDLSDSDGGIDENIDISGTADNDVHLEQQDELEINKSDVAPILEGTTNNEPSDASNEGFENEFVSVSGVYLSESEIHLTIEDKPIQLLVTVVPENADNQTIAWSSSNPEVATVVDGVVTPLTAGMTTVTAVSNDGDFSASCLITATDPGVPVRKGQSTAVPVPHHPIAPLSQNRPGGRKNQSRPKRHWPGQQSRKYLPEACQLSADILHADYLDDLRPCPGIRLHALPRQSPPGPDGFLYIPL